MLRRLCIDPVTNLRHQVCFVKVWCVLSFSLSHTHSFVSLLTRFFIFQLVMIVDHGGDANELSCRIGDALFLYVAEIVDDIVFID